MEKTVSYTNLSGANRYAYLSFIMQERHNTLLETGGGRVCFGNIQSALVNDTNKVDKIIIDLLMYKKPVGSANNHVVFTEEEVIEFTKYVKSLFPIFEFKILQKSNDLIIKLLFDFDKTLTKSHCNQIRVILNLLRRLFEAPRSQELMFALTLHKENWHDLSLLQLITLGEIIEYDSTNDHKLIGPFLTVLPEDAEIIKRVCNGANNQIFDMFRGSEELKAMKTGRVDFARPTSLFRGSVPTTLTPELRAGYEVYYQEVIKLRERVKAQK